MRKILTISHFYFQNENLDKDFSRRLKGFTDLYNKILSAYQR